MAFDKTKYLQKKFIDHALGKAAFTMPATAYLALFTGNPTEDGLLATEVVGGSYARQNLTAVMALADITTGISSNSAILTFPAPTADWGLVAYGGIMDALTVGNMLYYGAFPAPRDMTSGSVVMNFPVGTIQVKEE
jgi:hypothetical protein